MNYKWTIGGSIAGFFAGAFFVLSNDADITANVIGASGPSSGIAAVAGIALIVVSAGLFITGISNLESLAAKSNYKHKKTPEPASTYIETPAKEDYKAPKDDTKE